MGLRSWLSINAQTNKKFKSSNSEVML